MRESCSRPCSASENRHSSAVLHFFFLLGAFFSRILDVHTNAHTHKHSHINKNLADGQEHHPLHSVCEIKKIKKKRQDHLPNTRNTKFANIFFCFAYFYSSALPSNSIHRAPKSWNRERERESNIAKKCASARVCANSRISSFLFFPPPSSHLL